MHANRHVHDFWGRSRVALELEAGRIYTETCACGESYRYERCRFCGGSGSLPATWSEAPLTGQPITEPCVHCCGSGVLAHHE